jgi:uncharacterized protein (TIGR02611 family)
MKRIYSIAESWNKAKHVVPTPIRMITIFILGLSVLLVGVVLLVLPGPGILFIFVGLAILASEFAWAASMLRHSKKAGNGALDKIKNLKSNNK